MSEVKRIAIFGTESTGKMELAQRLAKHFGEPRASQFVREDTRAGKIAAADLEAIARGQIAAEDAAEAKAKRALFCDTDLLTCALWNEVLFPKAAPAWIAEEADKRAKRYALYLLCDADGPFKPDPQHCFPDPESREKARRAWREALVSRGLPFVEITGDWAAREQAAIAAVEKILE